MSASGGQDILRLAAHKSASTQETNGEEDERTTLDG